LRKGLGGWAYFFNVPMWARKAGCRIQNAALGTDYETAVASAETVLLPAFDAWHSASIIKMLALAGIAIPLQTDWACFLLVGFFSMRWFIGFVFAFVVLISLYLGSAVFSISQLVEAARAGDGAAVIARTDVKALNRSLTDQIVGAYLQRIGATRRISPTERMLVNTYGASVADAMVSRMLTADRLTRILNSGGFDGSETIPSFSGIGALADLRTGDILGLIGRLNIVRPLLLSIRISKTTDPDSYAAISMHYEGLDWKLAGIDLPQAVVRDLAASLPAR
jgi:uncharacterized membrane protein YphA (DoxX/SURF4 family)